MLQLQAGYFVEELVPVLRSGTALAGQEAEARVRALLHSLSWFDIAHTQPFPATEPDYGVPSDKAESGAASVQVLWAVAINLLTRGLPTRAPLYLAAAVLAENWPGADEWLTAGGTVNFEKIDSEGSLKFALPDVADPAAWAALLWRALHPLDPRLRPGPALRQQLETWQTPQNTVSYSEILFAAEILHEYGGAGYLPQLLSSQTSLENLLSWSADEDEKLHKTNTVILGDFAQQEADFTLPLPYEQLSNASEDAVRGIVLEVDGPHHKIPPQPQKDAARDKAARAIGWLPVRLPVESTVFDHPAERLEPLRQLVADHPYFAQLRANYDDSLLATLEGRQALQLTLGPLAMARVQRTLLEVFLRDITLGIKPIIRLAVVERDVPCAQLAVATLLAQLRQLYALEGKQRALPQVDLHVFPSGEFSQPTQLAHPGTVVMAPGIEPHAADRYDLLLDVSVLQRPGFSTAVNLPGVQCLTIRTAAMPREPRRFRSAPLVSYPALTNYIPAREIYEQDAAQKVRGEVLEELVQDIFRKRRLREGQLPIISRGLQGLSVLGLLPTGGGKSLTYQLAVLLQPGVALVVAPIKSLMQDQFEGLARNWIDAATYLNSAVAGRPRKQLRIKRLQQGELLFLFVSPERLVIKEDFRDPLRAMKDIKPRVAFSFCVIDEAHCVSEWGHNFRTPYLRLGANARKHCLTYDGRKLPLYGLTATASFDVLADVQRELHLDDDEGAVIRTATMARPELHVRIVPVDQKIRDEKTAGRNKHQLLDALLPAIPAALRELDGKSSLLELPEKATLPAPLQNWTTESFYRATPGSKFEQAGLIFCPTKNTDVGVTKIHARLGEAKRPGPPLRVGYFMGSDDDSSQQEREKQGEAMAAMQTQFVNDDLNLMVATKAFGMGIDKPNVRFTVHYGYPDSIESFVQEAGRAGRDRAVALNYILYHPSDAAIQQFFFKNTHKEREQEMRVMQELLTRITFPSDACAALNAALAEAFPELELWPRLYSEKSGKPPIALYVNDEDGLSYYKISFAKLPDLEGSEEKSKPAGPFAVMSKVGNFTMRFLLDLPAVTRTNAATLATALGGGAAPASIDGILPRWEAPRGDWEKNKSFSIGFRNGRLHEISKVAAAAGFFVTEKALLQFRSDATNGDSFAAAIRDYFRQSSGEELPEELLTALAQKFFGIRLKQDTFQAIHRLCLLGVVADYTVNYSASTVQVHLADPQTPEQLLATYQAYLTRYTTPQNARAQAAAVANREKGNSLLEKYVGALLDFNKTEIKAKRQQGILNMAAACEMGLSTDSKDNLSDYFDLYFNSKYARTAYLPADTQQGKAFDQATIWKYLAYMENPPDGIGKERDNIKHLRGACARLLATSTGNGAF